MNIILFIFWVVLTLYILLETDAVPKWAEAFGLKFFKYQEWQEKSQILGGLKYKDFLSSYHSNFFISLVTCQECLCVWLNIIGFSFWPYVLGGWLFFGISTVFSLVGIAALNFILRKLYE